MNGKKSQTKIMAFGTFDGLHKGHMNFFKQAIKQASKGAKKEGRKRTQTPFLIVSIARDKNVKKIKGTAPILNEKKRMELIKKCGLVDKVVLGGMSKHIPHIRKESPDIIVLGYDQKEYTKNLRKDLENSELKVKIIRLKPYKEKIYKNHLLKNKR